MSGYIYIRSHPSYTENDGCKLGKTNNIPERDTQYATGEIKRGKFELVIEMSKSVIGIVEKMLQKYFTTIGFHIQYDGGTEFYKRGIINLITPYLEKTNIKFKVLSCLEIEDLVRCNRIRKLKPENLVSLMQNLSINRTKNIPQQPIACAQATSGRITKAETLIVPELESRPDVSTSLYIPRPDQSIIVKNSVEYFQTHDKGLLILICGVGKTIISLWITQQLQANTLVVGVPNKLLLKQWNKVIFELFPKIPVLPVSDGVTAGSIQQFLEKNKERCIVITTYHSSHKVNTASQNSQITFDMKILDEVHHLTSHNILLAKKKAYIHMLDIPAFKQLSLTATLKQLETESDNVISNDNVTHFGEIIERRNLLWAIDNNIICDYVIQTIITYEDQLEQQLEQFNITNETDKRLFLSAYASLKSINDGHSHRLLIYSNNTDNSEKLIYFIKLLLEHKYFILPNLYYSPYYSTPSSYREMTSKVRENIIQQFETATHGIIACVYCLGEGWDFPLLDAVVFGENMSSNIRIVQSALRASRKYRNIACAQPTQWDIACAQHINKKTKIIIPIILNRDDWLENTNNPDLKKVREVIYQMGLEDETIEYKIKVCRIEIKKQKPHLIVTDRSLEEFGEYDEELTQKLRLKTTTRTALGTTYEKTRKILVDKNIKSKQAYMELCERDNRLTTEPELVFKSQFTDWIDFLSIQRSGYYELEICKRKVIEYVAHNEAIRNNYLDLAVVCCELCKLDQQFPPNGLWVDYYKVKDLSDIIRITPKKKKISSNII